MRKVLLTLIVLLILFNSIQVVQAAICDPVPGTSATKLCNPFTNAETLPVFGLRILEVISLGIGAITIIFTMFAGFRMIISQGNSEEVEKAKNTLKWTISGMVVAMAAYVLVFAISNFLGVKPFSVISQNPTEIVNPINDTNFGDLVYTMIRGFLGLVGAIALVLIVISGFRYITAQDNQEQTEEAKKGLQWAVLGLIVVLFAYVIVRATAAFFGK